MAAERTTMRRIRETLRLKLNNGLSHRQIADSVGISPSTITTMVKRAHDAGLHSWVDIEPLVEERLEAMLYPPRPGASPERRRPDPLWIHTERQSQKGVTLELLHIEYLAANPDGLRYTAFCNVYRRWLKRRRLSMRQVHRVGEKMFVDYSGQTAEVVDPRTGEPRQVEIFVAVLGASSMTFVEATESQTLPDWVASHVRACAFFGGTTAIWVPDQLRSAVSGPHAYDPEINPTYHELAEHYGATVIPARPRKPRDKAKAERGVQLAQRWILARLRKERFFSLAELNARISELLVELNDRPMKTFGNQTRQERFEALDRPALHALPTTRYQFADWTKARVNIDYHVDVEGHFYSVPYALVGRRLDARSGADSVEVFHKGRLVAAHKRSRQAGGCTTTPAHMPAAHRRHAEWSPSRLIAWGRKIGPSCGQLVEQILHDRRHPEQGYRACIGILRLAKKYTPGRLEAACIRAVAVGLRRVRQIEAMLSSGYDRLEMAGVDAPEPPALEHENVRGAAYFDGEASDVG